MHRTTPAALDSCSKFGLETARDQNALSTCLLCIPVASLDPRHRQYLLVRFGPVGV